MKRKVNRTKRAKIGSHGFKVYKNTYVYVAEYCSSSKPAPKEEVIEALQNHFNTSKSIRKMVKHIKRMKFTYSNSSRFAGWWRDAKQQFDYIDSIYMSPANAVQVMIHEIDGHAFWHWAEKWRAEERKVFNKLANKLPPVNDYVATYTKKKIEGRIDTIYENEQHSAITELIVNGGSYHTMNKDMTVNQLKRLKEAWELLHY